jgi:hypothetical protein
LSRVTKKNQSVVARMDSTIIAKKNLIALIIESRIYQLGVSFTLHSWSDNFCIIGLIYLLQDYDLRDRNKYILRTVYARCQQRCRNKDGTSTASFLYSLHRTIFFGFVSNLLIVDQLISTIKLNIYCTFVFEELKLIYCVIWHGCKNK